MRKKGTEKLIEWMQSLKAKDLFKIARGLTGFVFVGWFITNIMIPNLQFVTVFANLANIIVPDMTLRELLLCYAFSLWLSVWLLMIITNAIAMVFFPTTYKVECENACKPRRSRM